MKIYIFVWVVFITGCKRETSTSALPDKEIILTDFSYGTHPRQKMDVYLPTNRSDSTRIIIYLHGGGWYLGDKGEIRDGAIYFQKQGYAFISINYRLTRTAENHIHPAQMQDIQAAILTVVQNRRSWNLPDNKFALFGGSAGAHLSMLYAYKYDTNRRVKAVISMAGPTDLTDSTLRNSRIGGLSIGGMIESYIGASFSAQPAAWREASPIYFISSGSTPTFFSHGTNDTAVPYQQSLSAFTTFRNAGGIAQLEPLANVGHDLAGTDWGNLLPKMEEFLRLHVK